MHTLSYKLVLMSGRSRPRLAFGSLCSGVANSYQITPRDEINVLQSKCAEEKVTMHPVRNNGECMHQVCVYTGHTPISELHASVNAGRPYGQLPVHTDAVRLCSRCILQS